MEDRKGDEKIEPYYYEISGISKEASGYNIMRKKKQWITLGFLFALLASYFG